jgi:D-alanine--poly(phosphoribitol) ligase subunit 2
VSNAIIDRLGALFVECLRIEPPPPETDLFESGTIDSLQLVELLLQLERRFGVQITIENLDLDKLRTLSGIAGLVAAHQSSSEIKKDNTGQEMAEPEPRSRVAEFRARRVHGRR